MNLHDGNLTFTSLSTSSTPSLMAISPVVATGCTFTLCIPIFEPDDDAPEMKPKHSSLLGCCTNEIQPDDLHVNVQEQAPVLEYLTADGQVENSAAIEPAINAIDPVLNDDALVTTHSDDDPPRRHVPDIENNINELGIEDNYEDEHHLKILVVDDSRMNRRMNIKVLATESELKSAIFMESDDGDVAVEMVTESILEGKPFDLILLDSVMLRMHGPQAAASIRANGFTGLIVGLTGNALPEDVQTFLNHGVDEVLIKPLRREMLVRLLVEARLIKAT
jgi:CheY-like chemotaxis protein